MPRNCPNLLRRALYSRLTSVYFMIVCSKWNDGVLDTCFVSLLKDRPGTIYSFCRVHLFHWEYYMQNCLTKFGHRHVTPLASWLASWLITIVNRLGPYSHFVSMLLNSEPPLSKGHSWTHDLSGQTDLSCTWCVDGSDVPLPCNSPKLKKLKKLYKNKKQKKKKNSYGLLFSWFLFVHVSIFIKM